MECVKKFVLVAIPKSLEFTLTFRFFSMSIEIKTESYVLNFSLN